MPHPTPALARPAAHPARRLAAPLLVAVAALAGACAEVGTEPGEPASVAFNRLPSPSILVGDTLRDLEGNPVRLRDSVFVYDADDDRIEDVPVSFVIADTAAHLRIDPTSGFLVSDDRTDTTSVRTVAVQATVGRLVPPPIQLAIVPVAPTRLTKADTTTLRISYTARGTSEVSPALQALLRADLDTAEVASWVVQYRVVTMPASLDTVRFVPLPDTASRLDMPYDTTGTDGIAARHVRARLKAGAPDGTDTLVVEAVFRVRGQLAPATLRFPIAIVVDR